MSQKTGRELKRFRESKGITLEQAAKDTCLRAGFLQELEDCSSPDDLPGVYRKLSLKMYSRYLGMEIPSAACISPVEEKARITPVGTFIRRMGRPPKANRTEPGQRSSLFGLAKVTSAAVVTVLALGLWSLNAKLSRLNIDDIPDRAERTAQPAPAAAVQQETPPPPEPTALALPPEPVSLDHSILLSLTPAPAASLGEEPQAAPEALSAQTQHGEATPAAE